MIPDLTPQEIARFRSKITIGPDCHLWQNETNNKGYGRFNIYRDGQRIRILAHRLAYVLAHQEEPMGNVELLHSCDDPRCCNPAHLAVGSHADNVRDAVERGRIDTSGLTAYMAERDANFRRRLERGEKRCQMCRQTKTLDDFHRNRTEPDGRQSRCKVCRKHAETKSGNSGMATSPRLEGTA